VGGEDYGGLVVGGADGEDVPGVGGDDEGGEEVELVGAVDDVAGADGADVGVVALVEGAFDLDAAEGAVVVGGDVVGRGFSPGLGDAEAALDGGLEEAEFGPLAAEFGVRDVGLGHGFSFIAVTAKSRFLSTSLRAGSHPAFGVRNDKNLVKGIRNGSGRLIPGNEKRGPCGSRGFLSL
jgi:hypothetical protein